MIEVLAICEYALSPHQLINSLQARALSNSSLIPHSAHSTTWPKGGPYKVSVELIIRLSQKSLGGKELGSVSGFSLGVPCMQALDKALKLQNEKRRSAFMDLKDIKGY